MSNTTKFLNRLANIVGTLAAIALVTCANADPTSLGKLTTRGGASFYLSKIGGNVDFRDYVVRSGNTYTPLTRVRQISLSGSGLRGHAYYQVVTDDGRILRAEQGAWCYRKVTIDGAKGTSRKTVYVAVMKERESSGFEFVGIPAGSTQGRSIEIANPDDLDELVLWESPQAIPTNLDGPGRHVIREN